MLAGPGIGKIMMFVEVVVVRVELGVLVEQILLLTFSWCAVGELCDCVIVCFNCMLWELIVCMLYLYVFGVLCMVVVASGLFVLCLFFGLE